MNTAAHQAQQTITNERLAEVERQGEQARRECRSRHSSLYLKIERDAFTRGWEKEQERRAYW